MAWCGITVTGIFIYQKNGRVGIKNEKQKENKKDNNYHSSGFLHAAGEWAGINEAFSGFVCKNKCT